MTLNSNRGFVSLFVRHRVAANLFMMIMVLAGLWGINKLRTQFLPTFELGYVVVSVAWNGASAEDIEEGITIPIEQELRTLDRLYSITSSSLDGYSSVVLQFEEGTDMSEASDSVKEAIDLVTNLPSTAEKPEVKKYNYYEKITDMILTGPVSRAELVPLARIIESDLLARGIAKIDISGLPDEEISIELSSAKLNELQITLNQVAQRISGQSKDIPAGKVGGGAIVKQLRSLDQSRSSIEFEKIPLLADQNGKYVFLGDVADISRQPKSKQVAAKYKGQPAIQFSLKRSDKSDSLQGAKILKKWLAAVEPKLPEGVEIIVFNKQWELIEDRISLLTWNGIQGIVLIAIILYIFLNGRVALWVMLGVPVSFLAALAALYLYGGTINMLSLFGLIMALGIIVDDAIVVGEDSLTHFDRGETPLDAAEGGAKRMLAPVFASSLTTIAAFFPLMMISGHMGKILFDIPLVVICVIIASLFECFLVLPGHLKHSFEKTVRSEPSKLRQFLDSKFDSLKENYFHPLVSKAIEFRWTTILSAFAMLIIVLSYWSMGFISFTFFPSPEGKMLVGNVTFVSGASKDVVEKYIRYAEDAVYETNDHFGGGLLTVAATVHGTSSPSRGTSSMVGDQYGWISVELLDPDKRDVTNSEFMEEWKRRVHEVPGLDSFTVEAPKNGPPGKSIDIRLKGDSLKNLKAASEEIQNHIRDYNGVSVVTDNLPYGHQQIIFKLNAQGQALGLTPQEIGRQLRGGYDGYKVQVFQDGTEKVEVWVRLAEAERDNLGALDQFGVKLPNGERVALSTVVDMREAQGFEKINHSKGTRVVSVSADVDSAIANSNRILAEIRYYVVPKVEAKYGVKAVYEGTARDQSETINDMMYALILAIVVIFIILSWVFSSYGWPIVVMMAIPFGLIGAITGHVVMGLDMTILSLFGMFGLTGIVVNDSIILVVFYKHLREKGVAVNEALATASTQRFRAVLLTSLTTIGGLIFLVTETSMQAQFLIPMAVSMAFGLAFSTILVLLVIPAGLSVQESINARIKRIFS